MQHDSISHEPFASQSNQPFHDSDPISPLRALVDPRFSNLFIRAAVNRERQSQHQVSPNNLVHSPSTVTVHSNAWIPETSTTKLETTKHQPKKQCLTPIWKNRLQGLLLGLLITAIAIGITVAIFLTRTSTNTSTSTTATACGSLRWNPIGVTVAGNGTSGNTPSQLYSPDGVYVDSNNVIYAADTNNDRVQQWLPNAVNGTTIAGTTGSCGSGNGLLCNPARIYGDSQQNLYIADSYGIYLWPLGSSVGTLINGTSTSTISTIYGIFVDKNRYLYASVGYNYSVMMWTSSTSAGTIVAGGNSLGYSSSQLYVPYGLTVDSSSNTIYVANYDAHTIVAWQIGASSGTIVAGRNSTFGAGSTSLRNPRDVKRDSNGNLYVADTGNNRVLLFCQNPPNTTAITIADTGLNSPQSIALDSNLNVYVADTNNHRIQKFNRIV